MSTPTVSTEESAPPTPPEPGRTAALVQRGREHVRADLRGTLWRNRRHLAPAGLAAGAAGAGLGGAVLEHAPEVTALGAGGVSAGCAALAAAAAWRRLRSAVDRGWGPRLRAGLAGGIAWAGALPLVGADQASMWAALGLGTTAASARWWQHHRPGIPNTPAVDDPPARPALPAVEAGGESEPARLRRLWRTRIATEEGRALLPGSVLEAPTSVTEQAIEFPLQLDGQRHAVEDVRGLLTRIAGVWGCNRSQITVEGTPADESRVTLRYLRSLPSRDRPHLTEPVAQWDHQGALHLAVGPHQDGQGYAYYTPYSPGSVYSGVVAGPTGTGKSQTLNALGLGLRAELGAELWYLDPQGGQSSPELVTHADWAFPGLGPEEGSVAWASELLTAVQRLQRQRSRWLRLQGQGSYTLDSGLTPIIVVIDEFNDMIQAGYAGWIAKLARKTRKNGIGFLIAAHGLGLDTFANQQLRSPLAGYNTIALADTGAGAANVAAALGVMNPIHLTAGQGSAKSQHPQSRPHAPFVHWIVPQAGELLGQYPAQGIDNLSARWAGEEYQHRHARARERAEQERAELEALERGEEPAFAPQPSPRSAPSSSLPRPPLVGAKKASEPPRPTEPDPDPDDTAGALADRHRQLLHVLARHDRLSVAQLADEVAASAVSVRKWLKPLLEAGLVARTDTRGEYRRVR